VDPGPRWIYGFTAGCLLGPLTMFVASLLLWEFCESWWEASNGEDMQYFGLMCDLIFGNAILFIPSFFVGGWVCATVADHVGCSRRH